MLHPHFMDVIRSIYEHGMYVEELNTNGFFITQEIFDEMKEIGCHPLMKISFDGVGHHDCLRNRKGAEEDALRAIRLCIGNGFCVKAQTNVHRLNVHSMLPTAQLLNDMGVSEMRMIRTTEAPRWLQNAGDACLTLEEYFDPDVCSLKEITGTNSMQRYPVIAVRIVKFLKITSAMALDLAPYNIQVNPVAPGFIYIGMTQASFDIPEVRAQSEALNLFLASSKERRMNHSSNQQRELTS